MKQFFILLVSCVLFSCASQKKNQAVNSLEINTENVQCYNEKIGFKIEKILSDSRCPKGVQCVRLGEVELLISVYHGNKKTEEKTLIIDYKHFEENKLFFESHISLENKKTASISILPEKIAGEQIENHQYILKITFE